MIALEVLRVGAVSPVGLAAEPACAAFRAGVKGLQDVYHPPFPAEPIVGGRVPGSERLRRTHRDWLANLATRALAECIDGFDAANRTALLLNLPEVERAHPEVPPDPTAILLEVQRRLGVRFHSGETICGGHAGVLVAVARARELLAAGVVDFCCVGGVDSLVNAHDVQRLQATSRLKDDRHPMGVMPSEGAGFIVVGAPGSSGQPFARILGVGTATDGANATGARGLQQAFERALADAHVHESSIDFVVSDFTGERHRALDYMIAEMRTFRTIRSSMPRWAFAEVAGDLNAAAGAFTVLLAAMAHVKGYAPGPTAMCVGSSESGTHAACVVQAVSDDTQRS